MRPLTEALSTLPERHVFWVLHGNEDDAPAQVRDLSKTGCKLTFFSNTNADNFFNTLAEHLGPPSWIQNPIASLMRDHADIVSPSGSEIKNLLRSYGEELDFLARSTAIHRQRLATNGKKFLSTPSGLSEVSFNDIKKALVSQEFFLEYQPIIDLHNGSIVSIEALLRWLHPNEGVMLPSVFEGIAEEVGLLGSIGNWVIHEACQAAQCWPKNIGLAINVYSPQFLEGKFFKSISDAIENTGIDPNRMIWKLQRTHS